RPKVPLYSKVPATTIAIRKQPWFSSKGRSRGPQVQTTSSTVQPSPCASSREASAPRAPSLTRRARACSNSAAIFAKNPHRESCIRIQGYPMKAKPADRRTLPLSHTVATLAYRAAKPIRGAPSHFGGYRPAPPSRSAGEILAHMCDLMDWVLSQAQGKEQWRNSKPRTWEEDAGRFFTALSKFDEYLASGATLHITPGRAFQGAVADALTHTGQIAMLRRLAGARVRGENYSLAEIEMGRTGPDQRKPVSEFGK